MYCAQATQYMHIFVVYTLMRKCNGLLLVLSLEFLISHSATSPQLNCWQWCRYSRHSRFMIEFCLRKIHYLIQKINQQHQQQNHIKKTKLTRKSQQQNHKNKPQHILIKVLILFASNHSVLVFRLKSASIWL